jgi:hypothetical protein
MNLLKKTTIAISLLVSVNEFTAQNISIAKGGQTPSKIVKGSDVLNFMSGGNHYFFTTYSERAVMQYHMQSFDNGGALLADKTLEVKVGVFNNSYGIDQVIGLGSKVYAMVEHLDKPAGKNSLSARVVDKTGIVSEEEVEVMSVPFEKTMNSGFNYSSVSPDNKTLAVVGEMPYAKEQPAQFKIATYNTELKKIKEGTINLPGENTKNKSMSQLVANDGTVYLIRKGMTKKGEITLTVYQWLPEKPSEVTEYIIEVVEPNQIFNYTQAINSNNELIVSGTYYERKTLTVGEKKAVGVFYFTNKNKSEKIFKTFTLDTPVDNLTSRKLLVNGNTIFLTAEQYKEEKITPPASAAGSMGTFDFNYNYIHKNEFVIAMDADGNKKFQLELAKDFTSRDFDKQYYSTYFICNDKLTVVYNDASKKYLKGYESYYGYQVPVLVQITNDGLMQPPVIFKDDIKIDQYHVLNPSYSIQTSNNQISFLEDYNQNSRFITFKIN